jgi:opacity protein-like surface antigen
MLKKAAVVGFAGLVLGVSPAAAGSLSNGTTVALTMVGGGGLLSIGCMATALLTQDDDDAEEGYDRRGVFIALAGSYARENFSESTVVDLFDGGLQSVVQRERGTPDLGNPTGTNPTPAGDPGIYSFGFSDVDSDTFGFNGRVGYRCHPYISTELQYEWLNDFDGGINETTGFNPWPSAANDVPRNFEFELESLVLTTNVKGHLLTGRYQPFVLAGLGFMRMESKAHDVTSKDALDAAGRDRAARVRDTRVEVAMRFGGGLDIYLTENILVSAEGSYLIPTGKLDGMDYYVFGLGLQYRF